MPTVSNDAQNARGWLVYKQGMCRVCLELQEDSSLGCV